MGAAAGHGPAPQSSGADTRVGASLARPTAKCRQKVCLTGGGSPTPGKNACARKSFALPLVARRLRTQSSIPRRSKLIALCWG